MTTIEKARAVYGVMEKRAAVQRRNYVRGLLCDYMHKKAADQRLPLTLQQATGLQGIPSTTGESADQAKRDSNNLINAPAAQPNMPVSGIGAAAVARQIPQWIAKGNAAIARGAQYAADSIDNMAQHDPAFL